MHQLLEFWVPELGPKLVSCYIYNYDSVHLSRTLRSHATCMISYMLGRFLMEVSMRDEARKRRERSNFDLAVHYSPNWLHDQTTAHIYLLRSGVFYFFIFLKKTDTTSKKGCAYTELILLPDFLRGEGSSHQGRPLVTHWYKSDHIVSEMSWCPKGTWTMTMTSKQTVDLGWRLEDIGQRNCQKGFDKLSLVKLSTISETLRLWAFHQNFWKEKNTHT